MAICGHCKKEYDADKTEIQKGTYIWLRHYCCLDCYAQNPDTALDAEETRPAVLPYNEVFDEARRVDKNSIEAKLFQIIDDIDTAIDMFKPEIEGYEKFVDAQVKKAQEFITSDGYKLYYVKDKKI